MYALIHNGKIQVGPRQWNYSFFERYLSDNNLDIDSLPRSEPAEPIITDTWQILPVTSVIQPNYDPMFEQLVGPTWTIHEENWSTSAHVTGEYTVTDQTISIIKGKMKEIVTNDRYDVENGGCDYTFASDNMTVGLYTNRDDRGTYLNVYLVLPDGGSSVFKFPGGVFRLVTKEELLALVQYGMAFIQAAFDWEAAKHDEIGACDTVAALKLIDYRHPSKVE